MVVMFYKMLMFLAIAVLRFVDLIFDLFLILAGIQPVTLTDGSIGNKGSDILSVFVSNGSVVQVFGYIVLIGVGVGAIFTMAALIKNMITGKKAQGRVAAQYGASVLSMLIAFTAVLLAIAAVAIVLGLVNEAFRITHGSVERLSVGSEIMNALMGEPSEKIDIHNGNISDVVDKIVGRFDVNFWTRWEDFDKGLIADSTPIAPPYDAQAIKAFPYVTALLCACILCWTSFSAILGLIVRLYDIVFLMLAMPLSMAAYPLDDGARFRLWKETMVSKLVLAFGTIFAVNIYILLIGSLIPRIHIPVGGESGGRLNRLFQVLLIVCGGFTVSAGQLLFARLMGTDASEGRQMTQNFRSAIGGIGTTMGLVKGAGRLVFGKKPQPQAGGGVAAEAKALNAAGREGGLIGGVQRLGRGIGTFIGGSTYKSNMKQMADGMRTAMTGVRKNWNESGGIGGMMRDGRLQSKIDKAQEKGDFKKLGVLQTKMDERQKKRQSAIDYLKPKEEEKPKAEAKAEGGEKA